MDSGDNGNGGGASAAFTDGVAAAAAVIVIAVAITIIIIVCLVLRHRKAVLTMNNGYVVYVHIKCTHEFKKFKLPSTEYHKMSF